ncbi:MAG: hypothetical protein ACPGQL_02735 [Thermoplasmatota archaeon]
MARYTLKDRPLRCQLCGHDDFHWHEGLQESRLSTFFGFDWAKPGVDKFTCRGCGLTLTFARLAAPHAPVQEGREPGPDPLSAPGL